MKTRNEQYRTTLVACAILIAAASSCGEAGDNVRNRDALNFSPDDVIQDTQGGSSDGSASTDPGETPDGGGDSEDPNPSSDPRCDAECEFTTYNLDVQVGDVFVLANFVDCDGAPGEFVFAYEGAEDWNIDAFNTDLPVTITTIDLEGGNKGAGEYRLNMLDAHGEELDHMTIRINHGEDSDVTAADAVPPVASEGPACGASGGSEDPGTTPGSETEPSGIIG